MTDLYFSNYATGQTIQKRRAEELLLLQQGEENQAFAKNAIKLC